MSKQKTKPLNILIIEDDAEYVESLNRDAQRHRILLRHASSLEEGKTYFESKEGKTLSGVILDVVCMKGKEQELADNSFITAATKYFDAKAPHLPLVVLTGEPDEYRNLSKLYKGTWRVYSKGRNEEDMLVFLKDEAGKVDTNFIINKYHDVFEIAEEYLGSDAEDELINCLRTMQSSDLTIIKNNLACLRRLQEKIYIAINKVAPDVIPTEYIEKGVKVRDILRHLVDNGYVKKFTIIDSFGWMAYTIASDNGAHTPYANPEYPPTKYTVQAATHALMDLILWMKDVVKSD